MNNPTNRYVVKKSRSEKELIHRAINTLKDIKSSKEKLIPWSLLKKLMG